MVGPVGRTFRVPTELLRTPGGSFAGAMALVIFITIGFLSCWFLLYALMEWTQDPRGKSDARFERTRKSITGSVGTSTSLIFEAKKHSRRERCV